MVAATPLDPFAMWPAFPTSDYYGSSAPSRRHRPTTGLPTRQRAAVGETDRRDGSHVHHRTVRRARRPAMPLRLRHTYAADFRCGLPIGDVNRSEEFPAPRADLRRHPAHIRQVRAGGLLLRGFQPLVPHVRLPVSLAGPASSGSADTSRRCRGCLPLDSLVPALRAAPSFTRPLRRARGGVLSSPLGSMAPRGARHPPPTADSARRPGSAARPGPAPAGPARPGASSQRSVGG